MSDISAYYDRLANQYGNSPQAVDAPNQEALDVRYRVLGDVADMNGKRVLDVGCGYGGLGVYLTRRYPDIDYTGIDISGELIKIGQKEYPGLRLIYAENRKWDLGRFDVVVAQGVFYLYDLYAPTRRSEKMIRRYYAMADEAFAFTAISTWKPHKTVREFHLDPVDTLRFCSTLTRRVALRHDYLDGDLAVYLYRKDL